MKPLFLVLTVILTNCFVFYFTQAQTLKPSVLPSAGGFFSTPAGSLSWTLGETVVPTLTAGGNMLTQGFQQPEVQVKTGTVPATLCAGAPLSVPFIASGIISAGNNFIAQLSNASGSFSSPVTIGTLVGNTSGIISATIPPATPAGTGYRIRVVSTSPVFTGPDNGSNITISTSCGSIVNLTLLIEGFYAGSGLMKPVLQNQGVSASSTITDSITVELHNALSPFASVATTKVILNTNGSAVCNFPVSGSFYIVIKHRNAIQTWSANPVTISAVTNYNFTNAANKAYGNNQVEVESGVFAFYSGDITLDENIDLIDLGELENDINAFLFGYQASDLSGDGNVDLLDSPIIETNINGFVFSNHP